MVRYDTYFDIPGFGILTFHAVECEACGGLMYALGRPKFCQHCGVELKHPKDMGSVPYRHYKLVEAGPIFELYSDYTVHEMDEPSTAMKEADEARDKLLRAIRREGIGNVQVHRRNG